jgi:hypothetical protein
MNLLSLVSSRLPALRNALGATLLFASLPCLHASSYFVDYAAGSDDSAGTSTSTAWKHCPGDPAGAGSAAAANLAAGDVVTFKGGVSYVFTATSGIALRWSGSATAPIVYDGNSTGAWGTGRATFTDNRGSSGLSAFASASGASNLTFKNLEFAAIGGAATLPADTGTPVAARFGGGIAFNGSATGVTIDGCDFHDLGYTFNQRPMSADSILGNGIVLRDCNGLTISNCTFARAAVGIQLKGSTALTKMKIANCTFSDAMVSTVNQPPAAALSEVSISGCVDTTGSQFDRLVWSGYGASPRTTVKDAVEGSTVTLTASALSTPGATFQWLKNGAALPSALTSTLTLAPATVADSGVYSVIATNSSGSTVSNDAVVAITAASGLPTSPTSPTGPVAGAPAITVQPANTTVPASATATFSVVATGSPAPTYQWKRNGISIPGWTSATLALEGVSSNDTGGYSVVVTNSSGSVTSTTATLSIGTAQPANVAPAIATPARGPDGK